MADKKSKNTTTSKRPAAVQAKPAKSRAAAKESAQGGPAKWLEASSQFLREVKTELKKVTWPSRKQTISSTGVVVVLVLIVATYLGLVDMILARLVRFVIG